MKNIWDEGVSNTIGSGTVKLFHSQKFYSIIIYDSRWEWCKKQALRPLKGTVNERKS